MKIIELEDVLCKENEGRLYKSILAELEKALFDRLLQHTEGNQLKAARILGINRNTMRSKIRRLGINAQSYK